MLHQQLTYSRAASITQLSPRAPYDGWGLGYDKMAVNNRLHDVCVTRRLRVQVNCRSDTEPSWTMAALEHRQSAAIYVLSSATDANGFLFADAAAACCPVGCRIPSAVLRAPLG
jgi:hypothetical protein